MIRFSFFCSLSGRGRLAALLALAVLCVDSKPLPAADERRPATTAPSPAAPATAEPLRSVAPPAEATSARLGLLQSNAPVMGEDEMLDYLRSVRADCGASTPVHRGIVVADLRERLFRKRITSSAPAFWGALEPTGAGNAAREVADFRACGQQVPFPPAWDSPRSGGRWLGEDLGIDLDAPFVRLTAWRQRADDVIRYRLVTSEAVLRDFLAGMSPGTPVELEFIVSSAIDDEVRGLLLRVVRAGEGPPVGRWAPPVAGPRVKAAAAAAHSKPSPPGTLRLPDAKPTPRPASDTAIKLNETFFLGVGDGAKLGSSPVAIRLKDVVSKNDCPDPSSADCRRGPADIHLEVTANTGRSALLTFESPMMTPVEIPMGGFRLRMLRISPRPDLAGPVDRGRYRGEFVLDLGRPAPPPKPKTPTPSWSRGVDDLYWWWMLIEGLLSEDF